GHNRQFRESVTAFTDALLAASPTIPGLDQTVVMPARRLHFTLGVMSLNSQDSARTLAAAVALLQSVRPKILEVLRGKKLKVSLDRVDIMPPERGDQERAHVMWFGPADTAGGETFRAVANLVHKAFKDSGLLVDENRPLKVCDLVAETRKSLLHCTIVNTIYRKPRPKERIPFSYPSILASTALRARLANAGTSTSSQRGPIAVDFGTWEVNELQICEMGSWGPEGEYVAAARVSLS
ncbi:kinase A anchor protein, partial [Epithele typhae]|uniref:kinase A anchor protein n=1 Tax=Epithele typhae TaxID=378194 RepID=UPI002007B316